MRAIGAYHSNERDGYVSSFSRSQNSLRPRKSDSLNALDINSLIYIPMNG